MTEDRGSGWPEELKVQGHMETRTITKRDQEPVLKDLLRGAGANTRARSRGDLGARPGWGVASQQGHSKEQSEDWRECSEAFRSGAIPMSGETGQVTCDVLVATAVGGNGHQQIQEGQQRKNGSLQTTRKRSTERRVQVRRIDIVCAIERSETPKTRLRLVGNMVYG